MALSPSSVYNFGERHWQMLRAARAAVRKPATNLSGTCAVVGSSAAVFDAKHGSEIDAARHVLRLNNAPVPARWREHIGQRTTLRVNTHQPFREREAEEYGLRDIPQVVYCHHEGSGCWNGVQKDGLDRIAPGFVQATIDELGLQSGWPTSGLIAVALARSMCAEVQVSGLGLSKTQPCAKYRTDGTVSLRPSTRRPSGTTSPWRRTTWTAKRPRPQRLWKQTLAQPTPS